MKFKTFIGITLVIGGFIGLIVCAVLALVFYFQNPDMTELRRIIEYPGPSIGAIICLIATYIGQWILKSNE